MTKGISIGVASDTREYEQGIKSGVVKPTQDAIDILDKASKAGTATGEHLEAALKAEQGALKQTSSDYAAYSQSIVHGEEQATEAVGLSTRERTRLSREAIKTAGQNAALGVSQGLSGIDGTVTGTLGAINAAAIGIFGTMGGVGLLVGAGISSVVSVVQALFQKSDAEAKQLASDVSSLTGELEDVGLKGVRSISAVNKELAKFSTTTDGSTKDILVQKKTADAAGISFKSYAEALGGNEDAQKSLYDIVGKQIKALDEQSMKWDGSSASQQKNYGKLQAQLGALQQVSDALEAQNHTLGLSKERVDLLSQAHEGSAALAAEDAAAQASYASDTLAAFDDIGSKIEAKQQELDQAAQTSSKKTKQAVVANNVETAQSFLDAQNQELADLESAGAAKIEIYEKFGSDAVKVIKSAGSNVSLLQSLAGADPATVAQIKDNYGRLGAEAATNFKSDAQQILKTNPPKMPIEADVDTTKLQQKLKSVGNNLTITVGSIVTRGGTRIL